ncbi:hypothetical protein ACLOJK_019748 [Asimina triloba]
MASGHRPTPSVSEHGEQISVTRSKSISVSSGIRQLDPPRAVADFSDQSSIPSHGKPNNLGGTQINRSSPTNSKGQPWCPIVARDPTSHGSSNSTKSRHGQHHIHSSPQIPQQRGASQMQQRAIHVLLKHDIISKLHGCLGGNTARPCQVLSKQGVTQPGPMLLFVFEKDSVVVFDVETDSLLRSCTWLGRHCPKCDRDAGSEQGCSDLRLDGPGPSSTVAVCLGLGFFITDLGFGIFVWPATQMIDGAWPPEFRFEICTCRHLARRDAGLGTASPDAHCRSARSRWQTAAVTGHSSPSSGPAAHLAIDLLRMRLDDLAAVIDVDSAPRCQIGWWRWSTITRWIQRTMKQRWVTTE